MEQKISLSVVFLLITLVVALSGCGKDSDAVVVDFSKTLAVECPSSCLQ